MNRDEILNQIKQLNSCDLLVIGGGATGCGIALDAASRGLSVVLVEQNDFAEGTSGRSSKLVHGGVRYLEMAVKRFDREQYRLVKEGLNERFLFLRNAPHLTRVLPLVSPLYRWFQLPYLWAGLKLYDLLAGAHGLGPSGFQSVDKTLLECPQLNRRGLKGGIRYYDGQFNDSRMVLALALTAAEQGAMIANHLAVVAFCKAAGIIDGAVLEDRLAGERFELKARAVINATGPFVDRLRQLDRVDVKPMLAVSSGIHIVLDQHYPPSQAGLLLAETEDERVLFVLPWQGRCLVGTTDQKAELAEHPQPTEAEVRYLLRHLQKVLDPPPTQENIRAVWSGLRPLVQDAEATDTAELLRDFVIEDSLAGLLSIAGGKWTSYRRMAEKLVDQVVATRGFAAATCRTKELHLTGGEGWQPTGWQPLAKDYLLDEQTARHLHANYGTRASAVAKLAVGPLLAPVVDGFLCIGAEVVYAARHELAERAIDVLARRMPLALLDTEAAGQAGGQVIKLMRAEKDWCQQRCHEELKLLEKRLSTGL